MSISRIYRSLAFIAIAALSSTSNAATAQPFVSSGLSQPRGLAFDSAGNLYVANEGSKSIAKVTPAGVVSTFATGFFSPWGLAFDSSGILYVADYGATTGIIWQVDQSGKSKAFVYSGLSGPAGIAFDASGNLYVANYNGGGSRGTSGICKVDKTGKVTSVATSRPVDPESLAFDNAGNLLVADSASKEVFRVGPSGTLIADPSLNSRSVIPTAIAVDRNGNLYVASAGPNTVTEFASGKAPTTLVSSIPATSTVLTLAFDPNGNLYIADSANGIVYELGNATTTVPASVNTTFNPASQPVNMSAQVTSAAGTVNAGTVNFYLQFHNLPSPTLMGSAQVVSGQATTTVTLPPGTPATKYRIQADFSGAPGYMPSEGKTWALTVQKAVPAITWPAPAPISYGTQLGTTELNATSTVAGNFTYPQNGAVLPAGNQILKAIFEPFDTADYIATTTQVPLTVVPVATLAAASIGATGPLTIDSYGYLYAAVQIGGNGSYSVAQLRPQPSGPPIVQDAEIAGLYNPNGLCFDRTGHLYVANSYAPAGVSQLSGGAFNGLSGSNAGTAQTYISAPTNGISYNGTSGYMGIPLGVACDSHGDLFLTNTGDFPGVLEALPPSSAGAKPQVAVYYLPSSGLVMRDLAFDGLDNLFAVCGNTVVKLAPPSTPGGLATVAATISGFKTPYGLAFDSLNNLFVSDVGANVVYEIPTSAIKPLTNISSAQAVVTTFTEPSGIVLDGLGNLYVVTLGGNVMKVAIGAR